MRIIISTKKKTKKKAAAIDQEPSAVVISPPRHQLQANISPAPAINNTCAFCIHPRPPGNVGETRHQKASSETLFLRFCVAWEADLEEGVGREEVRREGEGVGVIVRASEQRCFCRSWTSSSYFLKNDEDRDFFSTWDEEECVVFSSWDDEGVLFFPLW